MAASVKRAVPLLDLLVVQSTTALRQALPAGAPLAALDVTPTHISLAQSDPSRSTAAPLGVLARTDTPSIDARILSSALSRASNLDEHAGRAAGLVVVSPPLHRDDVVTYARELLVRHHPEDDQRTLWPGLKAVLFFSEAHVLRRSLLQRDDYARALKLLPSHIERPVRNRFDRAMLPPMSADELEDDVSTRARMSASEVLQAVLDDMREKEEVADEIG